MLLLIRISRLSEEQFVEKNSRESEHQGQFVAFIYFFLPVTQVNFVIKLARATKNEVGLA